MTLLLFFLFQLYFSIKTPKVTKQYLWEEKEELFPYAHVCSITELSNGEIVAVYQAGTGEGQPDCTIYRSIRSPSGNWSEPVKAIQMDKCTMNPSIYQNDDGVLFLIYHYNGGQHGHCSTHHWTGYYAISTDNGRSFSNITALPKGFLGSVKNNCIKMSNGNVLCPSSTEQVLEIGVWMSHFETTDDEFKNWKKSDNIHFFHGETFCQGIIQPTIFESPTTKGKIRAMFRSSCGVLATAVSTDYGQTWPSFAKNSHVENPGSGVDMTYMKNTDLGAILVYNNSTKGRTPLTLGYSLDEGETWTKIMDVETDKGGRFAYPYIIQSRFDSKKAYSCYTYNNEGIRNMAFLEIDFN